MSGRAMEGVIVLVLVVMQNDECVGYNNYDESTFHADRQARIVCVGLC